MKNICKIQIMAIWIALFLLVGKAEAQSIYAPEIEICYNWNDSLSQWDSSFKEITLYDTSTICNGNPIALSKTAYFYSGGVWTPSTRYQYVWNNCLLLADSFQTYNTSLNQWDNQSKSSYSYDTAGNRIETTYFSWNSGTSQWDPINRYLYRYNNQNKVIEQTILAYNSGNWDSVQKYTFFYDGNGNETLQVIFSWNTGTSSWDSTGKRERSYDINGNLIEERWLTFSGGSWVYSSKTMWAYDGNGNNIERILLVWNSGTSQWDSMNKWLYSYTPSNQLSEEIFQMYNGTTWVNNFRRTYTYDLAGNVIQKENFSWIDSTSIWKPTTRELDSYDGNNNLIEYITQSWVDSLNSYVNSYRCTYGYQVITSLSSFPKKLTECHIPNPYKGERIICDLASNGNYIVTLYNLEGKLVSLEKVKGNEFQLTSVKTSGIYLLQVLSEKGELLYQKKLVIE